MNSELIKKVDEKIKNKLLDVEHIEKYWSEKVPPRCAAPPRRRTDPPPWRAPSSP